MQINIPPSAYPITRIKVTTPKGEIDGEFTQEQKVFDVTLPEHVTEDEVGITVEYLTNARVAVESSILKRPIAKPVVAPILQATTRKTEPKAEDKKPSDGE